MAKNLYTAREIIDLFDKNIGLSMTESNFAKHKKNGVFRIYKDKERKGDFYRWPEAAENFFENVIQKTGKGMKARAKYEKYIEGYRGQKMLSDEIALLKEKINTLPALSVNMFRFDPEEKRREDLEVLQEAKDRGDTRESYLRELEERTKMSDEQLLESFRCAIEEIKYGNHLLRDLADDMTERLSERFSDYRDSIFEYEVLKIIRSWIMDAKAAADCEGCDLTGNRGTV